MDAEKIICCDSNRNSTDPMMALAAMNGGMGGQWNNPLN